MRLIILLAARCSGGQFIRIALLCCLFASGAKAQLFWNVTETDSSVFFSTLSSWGNTCTAIGQVPDSDAPPYSNMYFSLFWRTDDGGLTWKKQDPNVPTHFPSKNAAEDYPINTIDQIDSLHAIAVGYNGLILETSDAGNTWTKQACPVTSNLYDVDGAGLGSGIIIGDYPEVILLRSESGWFVAPFTPRNPYFCHSYGGGKFRVLKGDSTLYTTLDAWQTVDSTVFSRPAPDSLFRGNWGYRENPNCIFGGGDTIIVGGNITNMAGDTPVHSALALSPDGGASWKYQREVSFNSDASLGYLSPIIHDTLISLFPYSDTSYPGGARWVLISSDFGMTWQKDTLEFNKKFNISSLLYPHIFGLSMIAPISNDGMVAGAFHGFLARLDRSQNAGVPMTESSAAEEQIYPNPVSDVLIVKLSGGHFNILDPLGRSYAVPRNGNQLDVSSLPAGVYFVSDGNSRAKFVKE